MVLHRKGFWSALALTALLVGASVASASAAVRPGNIADITLKGGSATALSQCVNVARIYARYGRAVPASQANFCSRYATAVGGDLRLNNVLVDVEQSGSKTSSNRATLTVIGGDAVAVAACMNYIQGTASPDQVSECSNKASARGGNVLLQDVVITIWQQ